MKESSKSLIRRRDFRSLNDRTLKEFFKKVEKYQKTTSSFDPDLRSALGIPTKKVRKFFAKCLYMVTPQRFSNYLPESVSDLVAEEHDVLAWHESKLRERVNDTQDVVQNVSQVAAATKEAADQLAEDIETAEKENWNAQQFQEYITEAIDIKIHPEVAQLLDDQFWGSSPEKQELRRQRYLEMLKRMEATQREAAGYLREEVGEQALETLNVIIGEYYIFKNICMPVAAVRDAAKSILGTNLAMFTAKDAVKATIRLSGEVLRLMADGIKLAGDEYSLLGPDMTETIADERKQMRTKLKELEASARTAFKGSLGPASFEKKSEVIDIKAEPVS